MALKTIQLTDLPLSALLNEVKQLPFQYEYSVEKHAILLEENKHKPLGKIRLPTSISINNKLELVEEDLVVLYLTIESGAAAIIVMDGQEEVDHTTFSAYMTRKKQGMSQVKYLKKKGKSRAGSRVRLSKTIEFFEDINKRLQDTFEEWEIERIAMQCSKTLIPYFYQSKVAPPFNKKDERLYKIPLHIPQFNYTGLKQAVKTLQSPFLEAEENALNQLHEHWSYLNSRQF